MSNLDRMEVKVQKTIKKPVREVFRAIGEGRLFQNCGAESGDMKIDFRVGGKYELTFKSFGLTNFGEFLEIITDRKIVFTWCETFEEPRTPSTKVTIELFADGNDTRMSLVHSGFTLKESRDSHEGGWTAGINDLFAEMESGKIRMIRVFSVPVQRLFKTCSNLADGKNGSVDFKTGGEFSLATPQQKIKGEFLEIADGKKIAFIMNDTKVTLTFDEEDDGASSVELNHEMLNSEELQKSYRKSWEAVAKKLTESLSG